MEPEILQEPDIEGLLGNLLEDGPTSPEALFASEPQRAILHTKNGRRAFDVLPPNPATSAQVQQAETKTLGGALAPDAPPIIGIDAEWVWVEDNSNRIVSYQFAVIAGGHGWRGLVTCEDGHRLKLNELVGHALEVGVRQGHIAAWS